MSLNLEEKSQVVPEDTTGRIRREIGIGCEQQSAKHLVYTGQKSKRWRCREISQRNMRKVRVQKFVQMKSMVINFGSTVHLGNRYYFTPPETYLENRYYVWRICVAPNILPRFGTVEILVSSKERVIIVIHALYCGELQQVFWRESD